MTAPRICIENRRERARAFALGATSVIVLILFASTREVHLYDPCEMAEPVASRCTIADVRRAPEAVHESSQRDRVAPLCSDEASSEGEVPRSPHHWCPTVDPLPDGRLLIYGGSHEATRQ